MSRTVTLGGDRLGSGKKQRVELHGFERSTHDLGYVWRNTQAPGTLVPFMSMLALPGDSFSINLNADVKTHPTVGPLFGSFKLQMDVFQCPVRLYNKFLHNNKLKIGLNMSQVKLPLIRIDGNSLNFFENEEPGDNIPVDMQQINPSSIFSYLGIRGLGHNETNNLKVQRSFNMTPYLAYWDIYKNYYANKSEGIGYVIHTNQDYLPDSVGEGALYDFAASGSNGTVIGEYTGNGQNVKEWFPTAQTILVTVGTTKGNVVEKCYVNWIFNDGIKGQVIHTTLIDNLVLDNADPNVDYYDGSFIIMGNENPESFDRFMIIGFEANKSTTLTEMQNFIKLQEFPLENIDEMREQILENDGEFYVFQRPIPQPAEPNAGKFNPFTLPLETAIGTKFYEHSCMFFNQEGLAIKTYQSDIFNNWLDTEWLDGDNEINAITAINTEEGSFTIDTLNISKKVYDMLNRIAVSGGSYDDWVESVYDIDNYRRAETPMYMGGLSQEIVFQEVISNAAAKPETGEQPLGTLAGKGRLSDKKKGGYVEIKVSEPSYLIGIVSITPRIDYFQGNNFDVNFRTVDDFHKPSLDEIGFQDLITDKMAAWDTLVSDDVLTFKSAGKQPAWLDYMTNYNRLHGNFADERNEMFMTLARRYEGESELVGPENVIKIKDLTTYIDPTKFNYAFAQTDLTAQNFWVQIGADITARRKISAKQIPNL